jgi:hypothetical protein
VKQKVGVVDATPRHRSSFISIRTAMFRTFAERVTEYLSVTPLHNGQARPL